MKTECCTNTLIYNFNSTQRNYPEDGHRFAFWFFEDQFKMCPFSVTLCLLRPLGVHVRRRSLWERKQVFSSNITFHCGRDYHIVCGYNIFATLSVKYELYWILKWCIPKLISSNNFKTLLSFRRRISIGIFVRFLLLTRLTQL